MYIILINNSIHFLSFKLLPKNTQCQKSWTSRILFPNTFYISMLTHQISFLPGSYKLNSPNVKLANLILALTWTQKMTYFVGKMFAENAFMTTLTYHFDLLAYLSKKMGAQYKLSFSLLTSKFLDRALIERERIHMQTRRISLLSTTSEGENKSIPVNPRI